VGEAVRGARSAAAPARKKAGNGFMDKSQQPMVEPELVTTAMWEVRKGMETFLLG
jgi:hypothetical protein